MPKNDFTRKINDFETFTKIASECRRFGQINCCQRLWIVAQSAINRPIWSHCWGLKLCTRYEVRNAFTCPRLQLAFDWLLRALNDDPHELTQEAAVDSCGVEILTFSYLCANASVSIPRVGRRICWKIYFGGTFWTTNQGMTSKATTLTIVQLLTHASPLFSNEIF